MRAWRVVIPGSSPVGLAGARAVVRPRGLATGPQASAPVPPLPRFIGDPNKQLVYGFDRRQRRMQPHWGQDPVYENEEDSPAYFNSRRPMDVVVRADVVKAGQYKWPLIPEMDSRALSNKEWMDESRQQMNLGYCRKYGLVPDIFPAVDFAVNLNVRFSDMYWHSAFFGNFIPYSEALRAAPRVHLASDPTAAILDDSLFTLVMATPDYPFRTRPEPGHFLHWMICNLPLGSEQRFDTVVDYMPPLPTEYAGHFRYFFVLLKQKSRVSVPNSPAEPHPFSLRRNFFLHSRRAPRNDVERSIAALQSELEPTPSALSFFHTTYDIAVTEQYQALGLEEPVYVPQDVLEDLLYWRKYSEANQLKDYRQQVPWDELFGAAPGRRKPLRARGDPRYLPRFTTSTTGRQMESPAAEES
eukprot:RCo027172